MKHLTPLITAALVILGLIGFVAFNATRVVPGRSVAAPLPIQATTAPASVTTTASPAPAFPGEAVYAGKAENRRLAVAIAVKGDKAAAYLCDGARVEAWLTGTAHDGRVELASAGKNAALVATLGADALTGTATLGTNEYRFAIGPAKKPAGLYRSKGATTTIGWIVLPDGSQVGLANTSGQESPAPPLDAASTTATVNGQVVTATPVTGETTL
jgi:hypothetical protein